MGTIENPLELVGSLKGAPISVYLVMLIVRQPLGETWIAQVTRYSQMVVHHALIYLSVKGLVRQISRFNGWVLVEEVAQLPLMIEAGLANIESLSPTTATAAIGRTIKAGQQQQQDSRLTSRTREKRESFEVDPQIEANLKALHAAGINGRTAEKLAQLQHINPNYIQAHINYGRSRNDGIGLIITRMQDGDEAPKLRNSQSDRRSDSFLCPDCHCRPCQCDQEDDSEQEREI